MREINSIPTIEDSLLLGELARHLSRSGYGAFCTSFVPLAPRFEHWISRRESIPPALRSEIDLFLLGFPVRGQELHPVLRESLPVLVNLRLLNAMGEHVQSNKLVLLPVFGTWLFCQWPSIDPTLYFGDDSLALLSRLQPTPGTKCLDLCTGPGIQALHCARFSELAVGVDCNPAAVALARINAAMNGLQHKTRFVEGDLYSGIDDERFDIVISNPPLLPFPDDLGYPTVGCGGDDGMKITWRILSGLPHHLTSEGYAQILGTTISDGVAPVIFDRLADLADKCGLDILMTVVGQRPLAPGTTFFEGLTHTASAAGGLDVDALAKRYETLLQEQGANHLIAYSLLVRKGEKGLMLQDLHADGNHGFWYVFA